LKYGRNGAIADKVGDVRFNNFKVADNLLEGMEFSLTEISWTTLPRLMEYWGLEGL
jgi:hypothetical protein